MFASLGCVAAVSVSAVEASLQSTRTTVEKWIETRQLISKEKSDWKVEQNILKQTIASFQRELESLDEQIGKVQTDNSQAGNERDQVLEEKEQLREASDAVKEQVAKFESHVKRIAKALPTPVMEKIDPLFRQLPEDSGNPKKSISSRMQTVVGIVNEIDKFNNSVAVSPELRKNPAGAEIEVQVLYVGLGQAYFVDKTGEFAGVGVPSLDGWEWKAQPELASAINRAIAIYENAQPADFVNLPMEVR